MFDIDEDDLIEAYFTTFQSIQIKVGHSKESAVEIPSRIDITARFKAHGCCLSELAAWYMFTNLQLPEHREEDWIDKKKKEIFSNIMSMITQELNKLVNSN